MIKYIVIEVEGKEIKLSISDAEKLSSELDGLFGKNMPLLTMPCPTTPSYPNPLAPNHTWISTDQTVYGGWYLDQNGNVVSNSK